jgi:drug/metabolite transporter (DMT)-like permease
VSPAQRRAILFILGSAAAYALAAAGVKALGGAIPIAEIIFFRNLVALPALWPLLAAAGGLSALATRRPWDHAQRSFWGIVATGASFYAYTHMPLALATALGFTMPIFLALLSLALLGERVGPARWAAIGGGFAGVLLILQPGFGEPPDLAPTAAVLLGAVGWAMAMITIRRLGEGGESGVAIVAWFALASVIVGGAASIPVWVWPTPTQLAILVGIGLVSAGAQLLMTEAYRRSPAALLAPFEYSGIVWTAAIGFLAWGETLNLWDTLGIAVLVGSGLALWRHETRGPRVGEALPPRTPPPGT